MRVDFQFHGTRLVVEVSGRVGHASDSHRAKDARRRNELTATGWEVREFTTVDVLEDPDYVLATVGAALAGPVSSRRDGRFDAQRATGRRDTVSGSSSCRVPTGVSTVAARQVPVET